MIFCNAKKKKTKEEIEKKTNHLEVKIETVRYHEAGRKRQECRQGDKLTVDSQSGGNMHRGKERQTQRGTEPACKPKRQTCSGTKRDRCKEADILRYKERYMQRGRFKRRAPRQGKKRHWKIRI